MIREDRIQLNRRFIKVFKLLEDRGDIIKNDRNGKGLGDFAKKILGNRAYGHIVRAYLNEDDKRCIDYRQARIICREYGVNESYLIDGEGTPFGMELPEPPIIEESDMPAPNILFTTTEAFAGSAVDVGSFAREDLDFFNIPGLSGNGLVAFPIKGNSMEPVIQDSDIVICREIDGVGELRDNKIYAVKSNGSLWVKYVQRVINNKGRTTHLKMISANHLEYDPFLEEVNEYTRLFQVIRRISAL
ncbi:S24 family peptidase [Flavilitoribacter nigricans]|uniref:Peptidase S24/S26A/S26B n=1 Tax=Flavilitoribacter nigricans (strain ATCC 23147 / DSM 23189 / NBRC 102662 / NCIMB 1420 / SS-2) TaxID=1122177 RepID=A0A2D0NFE3_FLAN2|nr:S24 family peptidase [Flavilitoribacter nigricans]PHN07205.1 peptidase S24/S26A/S26B [Flavilitoribacter nigricans DSM 23189 = NBRC 102662]